MAIRYLDEEVKESSIRYLDDEPSEPSIRYLEEDPSLGQIGTGLLAEIVLGEGGKYAGATAGALVGGPVGAGIGYLTGAIGGGITGSIAAQRQEGRDDISWGRVTADTLLNVLPFGAGKVTKGAKLLPRVAKATLTRGTQGAGISTAAMAIEKGIEEGDTLTLDELIAAAGTGAGLGIGLGAAGAALNKSYSKLLNKSTDEIDSLYNKGDVDAVSVVDAITGGNPAGRVNRMLNSVNQYILPSKVIGNRSAEDVRRAVNEIGTAKELAGRARDSLDGVYKKLNKADQIAVDKYMVGESKVLPEAAMPSEDIIKESREIIDGFSSKIIELSNKGVLDFGDEGDALIGTIKKNLQKGSYLTKEYRFYEDANYVPSQESRNNLVDSLSSALKKNGSENPQKDALEMVRKLDDSRDFASRGISAKRGMNVIAENSRLFKQRKVLDKTMKEFLGEYNTPGEKVFGTISRLGRLVAQQEAALKISDNLQGSGAAIRANQIPVGMEGEYTPLIINNQVINRTIGQDTAKENLYVLKEVNESIKQLYATGVPQDTSLLVENVFTKILSSTTGLTKFVKVPLAPAAYSPQLVGNAFMILGQGMNPFRGAGKGLRVAANEVLGKGLTLKQIQRYKSLGLVDKEIFSSDIRNAFNKGYKLLPGKLGKGADFGMKKLGKIYSAIDTANRITVFENYQKQLKDLIPGIDDAGSKNFLDAETTDKLAAELTNSTYQNYDRISPSLRYLSRVGVLNEFVSFNLELTRTTFNQARLAKSMVNGSFAKRMKDEYGVTVNQRAAAFEGSKRIVALSGALGAATAGIAAFNKLNGFDDEKVRAIKETAAPSWDESSALLVEDQGEGKIGLINMGYRMPAAELTSMFQAGMGTGSYSDAASAVFQSFTDKFFGAGTMNAKNIINTLQDYNPNTGRKISTSVNRLDRIIDQGTFYAKQGFNPGFVSDIKKWDERTSGEMGARYLTGERKFNTTYLGGASYRFNPINDNFRGIRAGYSGSLKRSKSPSEAGQEYAKYNENYRQNVSETIKHVNNLRILEQTDEDIYKTLPKNFSKFLKNMVMQGKVPDMRISSSISGPRLERIEGYVENFKKLPRELGFKMLEQEAALGKIKTADVNDIITIVKLQQGL
tara:strand:+ start:1153 stop:4533 length:3381 start_codon:yes stop_codon:yes gene_type:complete